MILAIWNTIQMKTLLQVKKFNVVRELREMMDRFTVLVMAMVSLVCAYVRVYITVKILDVYVSHVSSYLKNAASYGQMEGSSDLAVCLWEHLGHSSDYICNLILNNCEVFLQESVYSTTPGYHFLFLAL